MNIRIGFTGTREGMSEAQKEQLGYVLSILWPSIPSSFIHGNAIGADQQAASIVTSCPWGLSERAIPAGDNPLARNRKIVAECDILIAAPRHDKEELRSGTWATVRYARQAKKPVIMLSRGE